MDNPPTAAAAVVGPTGPFRGTRVTDLVGAVPG